MAHNAYQTVNNPVDYGMGFLQQWATPIAGFILAKKALSGLRAVEFEMKSGWGATWRTFGATAPTWGVLGEAGYHAGRGIGAAMAAPAGLMSRSLFGLSSSKGAAALGSRLGGFIGGGLGMGASLFMAPEVLLAQGLSWGAQKTVFEPYINRRRIEEAALSNFQDLAVTGDQAARFGRGISAVGAYRIGQAVVDRGWRELGLSNNTVTQIAGMGMANGLFSGIGDMSPEHIDKRLKGILESTKTAMRVFNMTQKNMQELQGILKQFMDSGSMIGANQSALFNAINVTGMATGLSSMSILQDAGRFAGTAQSMGLTGASGVMAGVQAYGQIGGLFNQGRIAEPWLGLYGGQAGLANAAVSGAGRLYAGPLGTMSLYNEYIGGRSGGGVLGTINAFAMNAGVDPLHAMAQMYQKGDMMRSAALNDKGVMGAYGQLASLASLIQSGRGKVSGDMLINMAHAQGMSSAEVNAMIATIGGVQSGATAQAVRRNQEQTMEETMSSQGQTYFGIEHTIKSTMAKKGTPATFTGAAGSTLGGMFAGVGMGALIGAGIGAAAGVAATIFSGGTLAVSVPAFAAVGANVGSYLGTLGGAGYGAYAAFDNAGLSASAADMFTSLGHYMKYGSVQVSGLENAKSKGAYRQMATGDLLGVGGKGLTAEQNTLAAQFADVATIGSISYEDVIKQKGYSADDANKSLFELAKRIVREGGDVTNPHQEAYQAVQRVQSAAYKLRRNPTEANRKELLAAIGHADSSLRDSSSSYIHTVRAFAAGGRGRTLDILGLGGIDTGYREAGFISQVTDKFLGGDREDILKNVMQARGDVVANREAARVADTIADLRGALASPGGSSPEEVMGLAAQVFAAAVDRFNGKAGKGEDGGTTAAPGGVLNAKTETVNPNRWLVSDYQVH